VRSLHIIHTLGTMCNLSLGVWEALTHTLSHIFEKKKKNLHFHVCLEILVDLKNCNLSLIGEFKILNT
jgi:hypothetical protein